MLTTSSGLALGSLLFARLSDQPRNLVALVGALQVGIGVYGLLTIAILGRVFYGLDAWWEGFSNAYWGTPLWLTFVKTAVVILPPTLCMGADLSAGGQDRGPRPSRGGARHRQRVRRQHARGDRGLLGRRLRGHSAPGACTPAWPSRRCSAWRWAASCWRRAPSRAFGRGCSTPACSALFVVVLVAAPTLRFADIAGEPEKTVLHYEEGVAGVVKVATDVYDRKLLSINGWSVAGTGTPNLDVALVNDYPEVQKMLAHLPMLLHPAPRRALVIGFGAGRHRPGRSAATRRSSGSTSSSSCPA